MTNENSLPSRQTLDELPGRAVAFLTGAGTHKIIRTILREKGYTDEEHALGWSLLHKVTGYAAPGQPSLTDGLDPQVHKAIAELDAWDEPNFATIQAALKRLHPAQEAFVFQNLQPATGAAAVVTVSTLLDRLDALESGKDRKDTHKEDLAALKTLVKRGYTDVERKRLRGLVDLAKKGTAPAEVTAGDALGEEDKKKQHGEAQMALRLWYLDWAQTAKSVITRRDYLIRLGLAKRRTKKDKGTGTGTPAQSK